MRTWQHAHASRLDARVGNREPCGDDAAGRQSPIGVVLLPGHEALRTRVLDPENGAPAQDVRPYQLLDGVEHARVADQVIQPLEQEESAASLHWLESSALGSLIGFELRAQS